MRTRMTKMARSEGEGKWRTQGSRDPENESRNKKEDIKYK